MNLSFPHPLYEHPGPWASVYLDATHDTEDAGKALELRWRAARTGDDVERAIMEQREDAGAWRDEERLPLSELDRAMATYSADGQVDDPTGGDASAEEEFGDQPWAESTGTDPDAGPGVRTDPDPDSEEGRRLRPSPDGRRIGPV